MQNRTCALVGAGTLVFVAAVSAQSADPTVFTVTTGGDSLVSFTVAPDGTLTQAGLIATGDAPQSISLSPDGSILAVGHGTSSTTVEQLQFFRVNADATFTPLLTTLVPDSPSSVEWLNNNVLAVSQTQIGPSAINTYSFNRQSNTIALVDSFAPGNFAFSMAVGGDLLFTETSFQSPNNSIVNRRFAPDGTLSGGDSERIGTGSDFAVSLAATSDGRFVYGAGGLSGPNDDLIFGFTVDADGTMTSLPALNTGTRAPAELALSPDETILYASNNGLSNGTGLVVAYAINPITGELTPTGNFVSVGDRGDANAIDTLPGFVFNLDGSGADNTRGVEVIRVGSDGSLTVFNTFALSNGSTPNALTTWVGVPEPTLAAPLMMLGLLARRRRA